jgi:hypothetical protein
MSSVTSRVDGSCLSALLACVPRGGLSVPIQTLQNTSLVGYTQNTALTKEFTACSKILLQPAQLFHHAVHPSM